MKIKKTKLKNGLTLITIPKQTATTASVFQTEAGGIFDFKGKEGLAHLLEHMAFKGTSKYPDSHAVVEASEGIGGSINAGTGKENMSFHIHTPREKALAGLEWLSEVALLPTYPEETFERESSVVIEEARMYFDKHEMYSAYKAIYNLFGDSVWGNPIEGYEKTINAIAHEDLKKFHDQVFRPEKSVLVVCGNIDNEKIGQHAKSLFGGWKSVVGKDEKITIDERRFTPVYRKPKSHFTEKRNVKQIYLSIAFPGPKETDPAYFDFLIANTVLGSGMGSKLFREVREKNGLCYYISSALAGYKRSGFAMIVAGLNVDRLDKAFDGIRREIDEIRDGKISGEEFSRAKLLTKTAVLSGFNDPLEIAGGVADYFLTTGKLVTPEMLSRRIDSVTVKKVASTAKNLFDLSHASIALVSPK